MYARVGRHEQDRRLPIEFSTFAKRDVTKTNPRWAGVPRLEHQLVMATERLIAVCQYVILGASCQTLTRIDGN
jgi:hypothetical protein